MKTAEETELKILIRDAIKETMLQHNWAIDQLNNNDVNCLVESINAKLEQYAPQSKSGFSEENMDNIVEDILTITDNPRRDYSNDDAVRAKLIGIISKLI